MISIKKRIIIRRLIATISLSVSVIVVIFVICIFPSGIHKKSLSKLAIPEDVELYVSSSKLDNTILNTLNSLNRTSMFDKDFTYELNSMIKNAIAFSNMVFGDDIASKSMFLNRFTCHILSNFFRSRNAAFMLWGGRNSKDLSDSRKYLLFDIGFVPTMIFNKILDDREYINIDNKYNITKIFYHGVNVYSISEFGGGKIHDSMYFVIHSGKLIFTDELESIKKIAEHLSANISKIGNIAHLGQMKTKIFSDISFYMNIQAYEKLFNTKPESLKGQNFSNLYGDIDFKNGKVDLNMHLINKDLSNISHNIKTTY